MANFNTRFAALRAQLPSLTEIEANFVRQHEVMHKRVADMLGLSNAEYVTALIATVEEKPGVGDHTPERLAPHERE